MKNNIFIGLTDIAGGASQLCLGFRALGHCCDLFTIYPTRFKYQQPTKSFLMTLVQTSQARWAKAWDARKELRRFLWKYTTKALLAILLVRCLAKYDIFIFFFNETFSRHQRDLHLLEFFHKKIIFIYCGTDSRPPYLNGRNVDLADTLEGVCQLVEMTRRQKQKLLRAEKYADFIIDIPPQALFHERQYISFEAIGKAQTAPPVDFAISGERDGAETVIVHAPSHLAGKGTARVREIISNLRAKGYLINYVELIDQPNDVVLKRLSECDFVIDQMWSDTPMAGLATEAAFQAKPTVVGGYYADFIHNDLPPDLIAPTLFVHPDKVEEAAEKLINDPDFRIALGVKAQQYAEKNYQASEVARKIMLLIDGTAPKEWLCDPYEIKYLMGWGATENSMRKMLKGLVDYCGPSALQLDDKPRQAEALLDFIQQRARDGKTCHE